MNRHNKTVTNLRAEITKHGLDGFIIPRADEHLGEYVPPCAERLAFVTGFTGSAGLAIVLADRAAVWSDGRYVLQLASETDPAIWERLHIMETKPEAWLKEHASGRRIGYDPHLISADGLAKYKGVDLVPVAGNLVDAIWDERPAPPAAAAFVHDVAFTGETSATKRAEIAKALQAVGEDAALLTDPASTAWLFNLRGGDVAFCPLALSYGLIFADGTASLFIDPQKLSPETRAALGNAVAIHEPSALEAALNGLKGKTVRYDPASMPVWFKTTLDAAGAKISNGDDPVALPRALKNQTEQEGSRLAHLRDGAAMVRFLAWFSQTAQHGDLTEISAATRLLAEREKGENFRGESFPAISGAGEHGAIIHYRVSSETNRAIHPNEVYLIDSGGQYLEATTDITRTLWTGPGAAPEAVRAHVTRVLAGHIALAMLVFPKGIAGGHIDAFARASLWQDGLDYDHGTGHGVGAYLSVHEGPAGISRAAKAVALATGMILSNEPGLYLEGQYGIRMENLMLVRDAEFADNKRKFFRFETLTLAPFDRALIEPALLTQAAREWLNDYHATVCRRLTPLLDPQTAKWLEGATAEI